MANTKLFNKDLRKLLGAGQHGAESYGEKEEYQAKLNAEWQRERLKQSLLNKLNDTYKNQVDDGNMQAAVGTLNAYNTLSFGGLASYLRKYQGIDLNELNEQYPLRSELGKIGGELPMGLAIKGAMVGAKIIKPVKASLTTAKKIKEQTSMLPRLSLSPATITTMAQGLQRSISDVVTQDVPKMDIKEAVGYATDTVLSPLSKTIMLSTNSNALKFAGQHLMDVGNKLFHSVNTKRAKAAASKIFKAGEKVFDVGYYFGTNIPLTTILRSNLNVAIHKNTKKK